MFVFSLAKELKKTVREIEHQMDAAELMEWVAYFKASDPEQSKALYLAIEQEKSIDERALQMKAFLNTLKTKR